MTETQSGQWPNYTYIVPEIYTRAKVRLIGLGIYTPSGVITNEFFASISTRLGDPRSADDLERVTEIYTRAKVRLIGLGIYTPSGVITNEFFASISTRLGDPRSADNLERVTG